MPGRNKLAEETHNPKQVVPKAMINAVLVSGVLGTLFLIVVSLGLGDHVEELTRSSAPVADVIRMTLGDVFSKVVLVVVCVAIFACGLVIMTSNSRLIHAMARDGRLPFSEKLSIVPRPTGGPSVGDLAGMRCLGGDRAELLQRTRCTYPVAGCGYVVPRIAL